MEEDIMILESECYYLEELGYLRENNHFIRFNQALVNLIKDYRDGEDIIKKTVKENLEYKQYIRELEEENQKLIYELQDKDAEIRFANRDIKVFETDFIPKSKIKEIVDECIPKGKNIITGEEEYQPNTNANSFLTQSILELMEDK